MGVYNGADVMRQDRGASYAQRDPANPAEYAGPTVSRNGTVTPAPVPARSAVRGSMSINDPIYGQQNLGIRNQIAAQSQIRHKQEEDNRVYNDWIARQRGTPGVPAPAGGTVGSPAPAPVPSIANPVIPDFRGGPTPVPAATGPTPSVIPDFRGGGDVPLPAQATAATQLDAMGKRFGVERGRVVINGVDQGPRSDAEYEALIKDKARNSPEFKAELAKRQGGQDAKSIEADRRAATLSGKTMEQYRKDRAEAEKFAAMSPEDQAAAKQDAQRKAAIDAMTKPEEKVKALAAWAKEKATAKAHAAKAEQTERFHQDMLSEHEKTRQAAHDRFIKQGEFTERRLRDQEANAKTKEERDALKVQRDDLRDASKAVKDHMAEMPKPPKRPKTLGMDQPDSVYTKTPEYAKYQREKDAWDEEHAKRTKRMQDLIDAPRTTGKPSGNTQASAGNVLAPTDYTHEGGSIIRHANGNRYRVENGVVVARVA